MEVFVVAHLMHIHKPAGYLCIIRVLRAISGCPVSYEVSYKCTLMLTPFRCSTHSLSLKPLNLAELTGSRHICMYMYFLECTCCTPAHLLHVLNSLLNTHLDKHYVITFRTSTVSLHLIEYWFIS